MPIAASPDSPLLRRLGTLFLGLGFVGVGVALTISAELGVAPYDVLTTGLAALTGMPLGIAAICTPVGFVLVGTLLGRRPGRGTLIAMVAVGPIIGLGVEVLPTYEAMAPRLLVFAVGFLLLAGGITAVIVAELGPGPAELVMLAIHERGYPLAPARTAIELTCVALGWAMGGQIGVGTVVIALLIGMVLRRMLTAAGYQSTRVAEASDAASPGA